MSRDQIVLSHQTALLYHRARRLASARGQELEARDAPAIAALLGLPHLDVLVAPGQPRPRSRLLIGHVSSRDEFDLTEPLAPGIRICSPELALWQLARGGHNEAVELLAYECCGTYAPDETAHLGCVCKLPPICSVGKIKKLADELDGNTSRRKRFEVRRLLASVVDAAASPAEAKLCLAMVSPRLSGGFGLPKPVLNAELEVVGNARELTRQRTIIPDGLWAAQQLSYEYLGAVHASQERLEKDAGRDNALLAMGYRVLHVSRRQVNNYELYRGLMETIRLGLHVRHELPSPRILERQYKLWKRLFGPEATHQTLL